MIPPLLFSRTYLYKFYVVSVITDHKELVIRVGILFLLSVFRIHPKTQYITWDSLNFNNPLISHVQDTPTPTSSPGPGAQDVFFVVAVEIIYPLYALLLTSENS